MKRTHFHRRTALIFIFLFFLSGSSIAQMLAVPQSCKVRIGDNMEWANPSYIDNAWSTALLGTSLKSDSIKKDIYAWFRIRIVIPSSMKMLAEKENGIQLKLGKIDDIDQTFFNGKLIGQSGSFPPAYLTKWNEDRVYIIPATEVQWDQENLVAVRIFSPDSWVGMYQGPYRFGPIQWSDFMAVSPTIKETSNHGFTLSLKFSNNRNVAFNGTIQYRIADWNNKELFTESKPVTVQPLSGASAEVAFANYQPVDEKIFRLSYTIKENSSSAFTYKEQLYLADQQMKIPVAAEPAPVVGNRVKDVFTSIRFQDQQQKGYLSVRLNQNLQERLLKLDEPGTLDGYLERPGHHPWAGEHIGKYLETACNVWKSTGNEKLKMQMDRLMYQLINAQLADGYLGTYVPEDYWTSWDVWSHKYNLYGLLAYYETTGYQPALEACRKIGDLLCRTFGKNAGQRDIITAGTHMGMAATSVLDPMVELYKYTGEKRYLDFCYYILDAWEQENGPKIISALLSTGKVTKVGNGKSYEMLSNFVGLANLYRVTGDEKMLKPLLIAWDDIVKNRLYITGTTSSHEYFQENDELPGAAKDNMGEGCVTTTWIQFNRQLFAISGDLKYLEQIERSVYNHLLGAENPETGCVSYYTPLMDPKPYTCYITCCQSSVPRGISMIPFFTFGNLNKVPTLMMYEPATYEELITTPDNNTVQLKLQVESDFPEAGNVMVTVNTSRSVSFPLSFRVPSWSSSFSVTAGGKLFRGIAGQSIVINRVWKPGDKVRIVFQIPLRVLNGGKNYPGAIALQRGPQILAMDSLLNNQAQLIRPFMNGQQELFVKPITKKSNGALPAQWIGKQAYTIEVTDPENGGTKKKMVLVPFADASQTGGAVKVWMPFQLMKK